MDRCHCWCWRCCPRCRRRWISHRRQEAPPPKQCSCRSRYCPHKWSRCCRCHRRRCCLFFSCTCCPHQCCSRTRHSSQCRRLLLFIIFSLHRVIFQLRGGNHGTTNQGYRWRTFYSTPSRPSRSRSFGRQARHGVNPSLSILSLLISIIIIIYTLLCVPLFIYAPLWQRVRSCKYRRIIVNIVNIKRSVYICILRDKRRYDVPIKKSKIYCFSNILTIQVKR